MNYCKYHPLDAATYYCSQCQIHTCDVCTNEDLHGEEGFCYLCQQAAQSLGSASSEEPFWRRLDQSFKYPLSKHALVLILGVSILNSIVVFVPITIVWQLMLTGAMMSYCFACLQQTAIGKFKAPDITAAYGGGVWLLVKLFVIFLVTIVTVGLVYYLLGPIVGNLTALTAIMFIPAAIILFGLSNSLLEALNPVRQLRLITAVGMPYGLILAFISVMTASVGIINELIGTRFGVVSSVLEAGVGNYYTVVLFHIMGYMIFQYQDKLGFTARADHGDRKVAMDDAEKTKRLVDILIKEGQFDLALEELKSGANKFPADPHFARQCFEFILASRNTGSIDEIGSYYLGYLVRRKEFDQLNHAYKRILALSKDFQADTAEVRHQVAQVLQQLGDAKSAAKVLNHLHREFPDYAQLPAAYQLMARCLEELPDMQKQARKYTEFAAKLDKQQKEKLAKPAETHAEEPGDAAPVQQAQQNGSLHGVVDQELVDSLTLVPTEEERQAEENRQKEAESGTFGQDPVDGMSLIPIDK